MVGFVSLKLQGFGPTEVILFACCRECDSGPACRLLDTGVATSCLLRS